MANTTGEKELKRRWPVEKGLIAGTTKQEGTKSRLEAQNSLIPERKQVGMGY